MENILIEDRQRQIEGSHFKTKTSKKRMESCEASAGWVKAKNGRSYWVYSCQRLGIVSSLCPSQRLVRERLTVELAFAISASFSIRFLNSAPPYRICAVSNLSIKSSVFAHTGPFTKSLDWNVDFGLPLRLLKLARRA